MWFHFIVRFYRASEAITSQKLVQIRDELGYKLSIFLPIFFLFEGAGLSLKRNSSREREASGNGGK